MDKTDKDVLQVTKEIVIKFIETQRVSPSNIAEVFPCVYHVVQATVQRSNEEDA